MSLDTKQAEIKKLDRESEIKEKGIKVFYPGLRTNCDRLVTRDIR
jgi:hypothetical protein